MSALLDVLLNAARPPEERSGVAQWPAEVRPADDDPPALGWSRLTREAFKALCAEHEPAQLAWLAAREAPTPAAPVPLEISRLQLLLALTLLGWITEAEAKAAAKFGDLPAAFRATIGGLVAAGQLPPAEVFAIEVTWASMQVASRADEVWGMFVGAGVATEAQVDDVFRTGAAL